MSSREDKSKWNVFEAVNVITITPEALMVEINSAITALEYARAAALLQSPRPSVSNTRGIRNQNTTLTSQ